MPTLWPPSLTTSKRSDPTRRQAATFDWPPSEDSSSISSATTWSTRCNIPEYWRSQRRRRDNDLQPILKPPMCGRSSPTQIAAPRTVGATTRFSCFFTTAALGSARRSARDGLIAVDLAAPSPPARQRPQGPNVADLARDRRCLAPPARYESRWGPAQIFVNHCGQPLTRDGVAYILS